MNVQELRQFYMDFLKEEGYVPKEDEEGDIAFKFEGDKYYISIDDKDPKYFRMHVGWGWKCKNDDERMNLFKAASEVNYEFKLVKTSVIGDRGEEVVILSVETLLNNVEDFKINFSRWLDTSTDAFNTLSDKLEGND